MNTSLLTRRSVRGYELRQGIESFAHSTAAHLGLGTVTVEWHNIQTAAINGQGNIILAAVADDAVINRRTLLRYVGFVLHELLHRKYSDFTTFGSDQYERALHNAIEDAWIERTAIAAGLTGNIEGVLTELVQQVVDESMVKVADWADPAVYPFVLAVVARGYGVNIPVAQGLAPIFEEAARRIESARSSSDTLAIARWVYGQLKKVQAQEQQEQEQKQGNAQEQGQGSNGEGESDGEGQGESDGEGQGESDGEGQGESDGEGQGDADGEGQNEGKGPGAARRVKPGQEAIEVEPTIERDSSMGQGTYWAKGEHLANEGHHLFQNRVRDIKAAAIPAKLRHEVRRIFDNTGHTLFTRNRKAGAINVHALPRAGVTDRVFQQRRDIEGVDSSVVICLDVSGSMSDELPAVAGIGAVLYETLHAAQVQTAIVSFGSEASVVNGFGSSVFKVRDAMSRLGLGGDTNDYAAVRLASDLLHKRSESRKVIFVVTDGEGSPGYCREACRAATALGITVIGVGLGYDVSHIYPNAVRVSSVKDLGAVVFNQIKIAA